MKLHLVNDEKIINRTIGEFESVFPGQNLWVVSNRVRDFKLVESRPNVIGRDEFLKNRRSEQYDEIYIHLLNPRKIKLLRQLDLSRSKIYWIVWGLDLYNKLLVPRGFRMYESDNSINRGNALQRLIKSAGQKLESRKTVKFIRDHIDYIVTDTTENDYDYLVRYYPEMSGKHWKDFFYYPIDVILNPELMQSEVIGNDIMIGNSASATNNHEHVIRALARFNLRGRRVVVPLSYSGKPGYVKKVIDLGRREIGGNFTPLLDFMPLEDYNRQQASTSVAIFGNLRQEAIGNIIIALYLGARVILNPTNPVYHWAKRHGLAVSDLTQLTQQELDTSLDADTRRHNRETLKKLYTRQRMHQLIASLSDDQQRPHEKKQNQTV